MRRLNELAQAVNGEVTHNPQLEISGAGRIASASDSAITFVTSEDHFQKFLDGAAAAAVVARKLWDSLPDEPSTGLANKVKPLILVDDVEAAFVKNCDIVSAPSHPQTCRHSPSGNRQSFGQDWQRRYRPRRRGHHGWSVNRRSQYGLS